MNQENVNNNNVQPQINNGMPTSPKELVMKAFENNMINGNPMMANLFKMAQNNDTKGLEEFAKNLFSQQGRDFNKEFNDFMNQFR